MRERSAVDVQPPIRAGGMPDTEVRRHGYRSTHLPEPAVAATANLGLLTVVDVEGTAVHRELRDFLIRRHADLGVGPRKSQTAVVKLCKTGDHLHFTQLDRTAILPVRAVRVDAHRTGKSHYCVVRDYEGSLAVTRGVTNAKVTGPRVRATVDSQHAIRLARAVRVSSC